MLNKLLYVPRLDQSLHWSYSSLCILLTRTKALAFSTPFIFSCSTPSQIHSSRTTCGCYLRDGSGACPPLTASVGTCLLLSGMQIAEEIDLLQREQLPTDRLSRQQTKGQVRPCLSSSPHPPVAPSSLRDANSSSGQRPLPRANLGCLSFRGHCPLISGLLHLGSVSGSRFPLVVFTFSPDFTHSILCVLEVTPSVTSSPSSTLKMESCPNPQTGHFFSVLLVSKLLTKFPPSDT